MKKNIYHLSLSLNVLLLLLCIVNWLPFILESVFVFNVYPFITVLNNSVDTTMLYHITNRVDSLIYIIYFIMMMVLALDIYLLLNYKVKDKYKVLKVIYLTGIILTLSYFLIILTQGATGGYTYNLKHLLNIIFWDINMGGLGVFSILLILSISHTIYSDIKVLKELGYKNNTLVGIK